MSPPEGDGVVEVQATVVRRTQFGWFCEINGKRMFVAMGQIARGFEMPVDGTCGPIALTAAGFSDLELTPP